MSGFLETLKKYQNIFLFNKMLSAESEEHFWSQKKKPTKIVYYQEGKNENRNKTSS